MEIRSDSWHWKLYKRYMQNTVSVSLCEYFWSVLFCIPLRVLEFLFAAPLRLLTLAILAVGFLVIPVSYAVMGITGKIMPADGRMFEWVLLVGFIECVAIFVYGIRLIFTYVALPIVLWAVSLVGNSLHKVGENDTYQLLKAYLKAKKEKVCPMLRLPSE
jgi:hypothetical protein